MKNNVDDIVLENQKLIYKVIKDMNCNCKNQDEFQTLCDYGLDGLINGAKTYDSTKGKLSTYLYTCIRNMINRHFYLSTRAKRKNVYGSDVSLYDLVYDDGISQMEVIDIIADPNINIEQDLLKKEEIENLINAVNNMKNETDKLFLCDYYGINGHKQLMAKEIEEKYNVSHTTVSNRLKRAKRALKKQIENENKDEVVMGGYEVRNGMKRCIKCNQMKLIEDYNFKTGNGKYRKSYCKDCDGNIKTDKLIDKSRVFINHTAIDDIKKRYEETLYLVDSLKKQQHDLETSITIHSIELKTLEWVIDRLEMDNDNNKNN